jgi:hypothetical protein
MARAANVVLLIDAAEVLENMGKLCFKDEVQIVEFYGAMDREGTFEFP